ncbi:hypothetical protein JFU47_18255 [Pseudomonas sp. TH39(2020)]|uniref:hypothetical protein n=1 Tax=Pseudomonas sp. TH39(2020) TaxID=2796349 RepID=UPI0019112E36|nr:hypothetical protein [Pseudomonas sp. TH39(2020)]MBK5398636.1 hypothetical protein [Pseudomonas sp. TH39(2020)]
MLPPRFLNFVKTLTEKTEQGEFSWSYDDNNSFVKLTETGFSLSLRYNFNADEKYAEYVIYYFDDIEDKEYRFYTNQTWSDFDFIRRLFDAAQASKMKLPF